MNFVKNIIHKFVKEDVKIVLGRWKIESCDKKINNKVDLSNEDHCGPCGKYILDKIKIDINKVDINKTDICKIDKSNTSVQATKL
uniref:Uncharacterized protein n=1 Tax=viral metagenome TaxID=1070528 RepID=A0A6C0LM81_9ZZZZ